MDQAQSQKTRTVSAAAPSRFRKPVGTAIVIAVTLGACYLLGFLHGGSGKPTLETQVRESHRNLLTCTTQLENEKHHSLALEARRSLDQAITALDARNFGIAEQRVRSAGRNLVSASAEARLAELAKTFESFRLVATEDLGPQRKQLADWVTLVDQALVAPSP